MWHRIGTEQRARADLSPCRDRAPFVGGLVDRGPQACCGAVESDGATDIIEPREPGLHRLFDRETGIRHRHAAADDLGLADRRRSIDRRRPRRRSGGIVPSRSQGTGDHIQPLPPPPRREQALQQDLAEVGAMIRAPPPSRTGLGPPSASPELSSDVASSKAASASSHAPSLIAVPALSSATWSAPPTRSTRRQPMRPSSRGAARRRPVPAAPTGLSRRRAAGASCVAARRRG